MASTWGSIGRKLGKYAVRQGPKLLRQLQETEPVKRAAEALTGPPQHPVPQGRPVSRTSVPTAHRARRIDYAPALDGRADPGEIVWTWVAYEEDPRQGKDRPVLVVGRDGSTLLGLMLSSNSDRGDDRNWLALGAGQWDADGRPSWVRLDRVLEVPEAGIRREGAILERGRFDAVAARLRSDYSWH
ncbi:type II toxin-antitoxin system PemK/MazF family toxin [Rhodococcus sp. SGAir0479]|uniref:type II toxin-antitoxin system PemK/MazF family toxin n=1 Tax=Rhodococcus sp. SGAir0479 TaxID=2567884 RepID=UPI0010CD2108|nr:type II toxin-antitoxin system PemK/MazF family toxin [Rhodococcus sp. SGAir0479]QCQ91648.1 type II toxin-antitoxin system PemK/MazF family toxin [Rhodococcus sp. SGAir0479]